MRRRRPSADHVVIVSAGVSAAEPRMHALCLVCGERLALELPVLVDVWVAANRAFADVHAFCRAATKKPT
jgi:hypothetical protein